MPRLGWTETWAGAGAGGADPASGFRRSRPGPRYRRCGAGDGAADLLAHAVMAAAWLAAVVPAAMRPRGRNIVISLFAGFHGDARMPDGERLPPARWLPWYGPQPGCCFPVSLVPAPER